MKRWTLAIGLMVLACAAVVAQPPSPPEPPLGPRPGGPGSRPPARPVFDALDADHDGTISAEEVKNASAALLTLDKNKDGKLTEDEYRPQGGRPGGGGAGGGQGGPGAGPGERRQDGPPGGGRGGDGAPGRGGDGAVGRGSGGGQGMALSPERMFTKAMEFDADGDGKLNKEELQKFIADFVTRHGVAGGGQGGDAGGQPRGANGPGSNAPGGDRPERPRRPAE